MPKPVLLADPWVCPGAYSFAAYCRYDNPRHEYDEFPHMPGPYETRGECQAALRRYGWIFHRNGTATCPKCAADLAA